jgi:hypothetical protein
MRDALRELGHDAVSCDLKPDENGNGPHIQGDVLDALDGDWDGMVAHPVCTRLTNAGVRWLHVPPPGRTVEEMWEELRGAAAFYLKLRNAPIERKAIENPIMHKYARQLLGNVPRQVVQPWWFGDPFFKGTGFELHNLPRLVATDKLTPPKAGTDEHKRWSAVHRASPGPQRATERSRTFPGLAKAAALQWFGRA